VRAGDGGCAAPRPGHSWTHFIVAVASSGSALAGNGRQSRHCRGVRCAGRRQGGSV